MLMTNKRINCTLVSNFIYLKVYNLITIKTYILASYPINKFGNFMQFKSIFIIHKSSVVDLGTVGE